MRVMRFLHHPKQTFKLFTCIGVALFLLHSSRFLEISSRRYYTWTWTSCPSLSIFDGSCNTARAAIARSTQVVVKTGGSEPQSRLSAQLASVLHHVPHRNILLFSDMEEEFGSLKIHDAYRDISAEERAQYPEFALYDAQQEYQRLGKDTRSMEGGWDLAKYMNLAMKRRIWTMREENGGRHLLEQDWFVFLDTDTFIEWDNLFGLLEHLDPADRVYLGSPVWLPGLQFAHGGSAYVLSRGAMVALNGPSSQSTGGPWHTQYGLNTTALCCGDEALARVLKTKGVKLKGYWPMFNGEVPATLPFGTDLWCEPVISLHHLNGEEMQRVWQWVEDWKSRAKSKIPLLFRDLFSYIAPQIPTTGVLKDWDNTHEDMKIYPRDRLAHTSFGNCGAACEEDKLCFQFVYDGISCALSHRIRLGSPKEDGVRKYTSGWNVERIQEWTTKHDCASAHWVVSNP